MSNKNLIKKLNIILREYLKKFKQVIICLIL
jgi:tRNA isopentenyl-2-thiomethyl-A-37 hydroxylase MiaE